MKALIIGCGEGGSRLTEAIMKIQCATLGTHHDGKSIKKQFEALILNTATSDLEKVGDKGICIDKGRRMLVGSGNLLTAGFGAGGNPKVGALAAQKDSLRIAAKIEEVLQDICKNPEMNDIDAFFVVSALGGGSGSGMGPVIAQLLKENYFEGRYPVIGIVTLPEPDEGKLRSHNAYISLQSWLKESNFDGIITVSMGGTFLKNSDDSRKYYSKFNKSVATSLYILLGGNAIGKKSTNVDVNDILNTIREGGGICTIGHISAALSSRTPVDSDIPVLGLEQQEEHVDRWEESQLVKKLDALKPNLFLDVELKTARGALLVVKGSESFNVTRGAINAASKWLEDHISGNVRSSDIAGEDFRLVTNNSNVPGLFEHYELSENDDWLSEGKTVEIAVLLSGLQNIACIREMQNVAEQVVKFTKPAKGRRLLQETLGLRTGDRLAEEMLLPCSDERDNRNARVQSTAIEEVVNRFEDEVKFLNPDINLEVIRDGTSIIDIVPIPEELRCYQNSAQVLDTYCFDIKLRSHNPIEQLYYKKDYCIRVKDAKTRGIKADLRERDLRDRPELISSSLGWNKKEQRIIRDIIDWKVKQSDSGARREDFTVAGIGAYPSCSGMHNLNLYKVKVTNIKQLLEEQDDAFIDASEVVEILYWLNAVPDAAIFTGIEMERVKRFREMGERNPVIELLYEKKTDIPARDDVRAFVDGLKDNRVVRVSELMDDYFTGRRLPGELKIRGAGHSQPATDAPTATGDQVGEECHSQPADGGDGHA